jgi:hypothetical protein
VDLQIGNVARVPVRVATTLGALTLFGCGGGGSSPNAVSLVTPACSLLAVQTALSPTVLSTASVSERTDATVPHGFRSFQSLSPQLGFTSNVYAVTENWIRTPGGPVLVRAQAHPATRPSSGDLLGGSWSIRSRDSAGTFVPVFAFGRASRADDQETPADGALTVPQLMRVGTATQQLFACVGARSADGAVRTTSLIEVIPPANATATGRTVFHQDLLSGDDRFVPNAPGPLIGPATPPTPTITNRPGNPIRDGAVQCAMTQLDDDVTTRGLHLLAVSGGRLYHSLASNFSTATTGGSSTFSRFNTVTPWGDVAQALGASFGTIVAAAITASRPTAVSVFFVAESGGRYRLHHAVRFQTGAWRAADDVLASNGGTLNGTNFPFTIAAGMCPVVGQPQDEELVYVIWDEDVPANIHVGRVAAAPQQWAPGIQGLYPPMDTITGLRPGISDPSRQVTLRLWIGSRPV